jgi:hypothetical protein
VASGTESYGMNHNLSRVFQFAILILLSVAVILIRPSSFKRLEDLNEGRDIIRGRLRAASDDATARLMSDLFQISKDKPKLSHGEMMREATLKLIDAAPMDEDANLRAALPRQNRESPRQDPYHPHVWAPFIVVGEPARMQ